MCGGGAGDKTPDVPSFDGALPCQCILAFFPLFLLQPPPLSRFQPNIVYSNKIQKSSKNNPNTDKIPFCFCLLGSFKLMGVACKNRNLIK